MSTTTSIGDTINESFMGLVSGAVNYIPKILVALILLLIGAILAGFLSRMVAKVMSALENNKRVSAFTQKVGIQNISFASILELFVKWSILLIFINAAVGALGIAVLTNTFDQLIAFVPRIFAAALIAGLTYIAGNAVCEFTAQSLKDAGIHAYRGLSVAAKIVVWVFGIPLAASQLGLDLTIITNNITVIVAGFMLAFGLAFGLGGKEVAAKILEHQYKNWKK